VDLWLHVSTSIKDTPWKIGAEVRYFSTAGVFKKSQLRPLRVGYSLNENIAPFIILQRQWSDNGIQSNSILGGIEFKF